MRAAGSIGTAASNAVTGARTAASGRRRERRRQPAPNGLPARVHFLDVGAQEYGDAVLCEFGARRILIDGAHPGDHVSSSGHPSIPDQLRSLLHSEIPVHLDLVVVTHAHQDHIGCLPHLVSRGIIEADWALVADPKLGWGRPRDNDGRDSAREPVAGVLAALREEPRSQETGEDALATFIADAVTLEERYTSMLDALAEAGTGIVRYGRDSVDELRDAFADVGLDVIGPSQQQLLLCADAIAQLTDAAADFLTARSDAGSIEADTSAYRRLVAAAVDSTDAVSRPGPAINLQSIVTTFDVGGAKSLFAGDMQFADPQIGGDALLAEVEQLWEAIREKSPFALIKLCHHGSDNGLSEEMLQDLEPTALYGICAGEDSQHHPNPRVLRLLEAERARIEWVRTDPNGLSTIDIGNDRGEPRVRVARGDANDPRPNGPDQTPSIGRTMTRAVQQTLSASVEPASQPSAARGDVEVITRVLDGVRRVTVTIDVDERRRQAIDAATEAPGVALEIAGRRRLPPLLFVTSGEALEANIGIRGAGYVLDALRGVRDSRVYAGLRVESRDAEEALAAVRKELAAGAPVSGVVIVGGLDVVPAQRLDCLPPGLRTRVGHTDDGDDFIVWSDEAYGDRDGDGMAELPVSRVPDARSAARRRLAHLALPEDSESEKTTHGVRLS